MVEAKASVAQVCGDAPVAVAAFILMVDARNGRLSIQVLVRRRLPLDVVVIGGAGQLSDIKEQLQRKTLPQFLNHLHFLRWCRSSSKTKACKFFRYATSALSR